MRASTRVRVFLVALAASLAGAVAVQGTAVADKPSRGCENSSWTASTYPVGWEAGQDFDPEGTNTLWQATLDGLVAEFGSVDAALEAFGVEDLDGFAQLVVGGYLKYDKNLDGTVCWKTRPDSQPAYYFNAVDNTANGG